MTEDVRQSPLNLVTTMTEYSLEDISDKAKIFGSPATRSYRSQVRCRLKTTSLDQDRRMQLSAFTSSY